MTATSVPDQPAPGTPVVKTDTDGRLVEDVDCRHCGYNLRGLLVESRCPECTTPVGRSVHGDLLRFCDPAWVEHVAGGMRLYVIAIVLGILFGVAVGIGAVIAIARTGTMSGALLAAIIAGGVALTAFQVLVYWKITAPDPGRDESAHPLTLRAIARYALIGSSVVGLVTGILDARRMGFSIIANPSPLFTFLTLLAAAAVALVGLVGILALFLYAISLARRFPDDVLAATTRVVMWGYVVTSALMETVALLAAIVAPGNPNQQRMELIFGIAIAVIAIPGLVFGIWGVVLLYRYRNRLITAASQARDSWARVPESSFRRANAPEPGRSGAPVSVTETIAGQD